MERKKRYINKALIIFKQEGLRMSLEELAVRMGISKKTLYNHFSSKEKLLNACIKEVFHELHESMLSFNDCSLNPIECFLNTFNKLSLEFRDHSPIFISDLQRLYPESLSNKHTMGYGQFREKIELNLQRGISEGFYRNDIDIQLTSKYLVHSIFGFYFHSIISDSEFSAANYFTTIVRYNMRAIVNDEGRKILTKSLTDES